MQSSGAEARHPIEPAVRSSVRAAARLLHVQADAMFLALRRATGNVTKLT